MPELAIQGVGRFTQCDSDPAPFLITKIQPLVSQDFIYLWLCSFST